MKIFIILLCPFMFFSEIIYGATVNVSGGGTALETAWNNSNAGDEIVITDSATYTQTANWGSTPAKHSGVVVKAASNATPIFEMKNIIFANTYFQFGSNDGGRIQINQFVIFGIQINNSGTTSPLVVENCDWLGQPAPDGQPDIAIYLAGSSNTNGMMVKIDNCSFKDYRLGDGALQINESGLPNNDGHVYTNTMDITNSLFERNATDLRMRGIDDRGTTAPKSHISATTCTFINSTAGPRCNGLATEMILTNCKFLAGVNGGTPLAVYIRVGYADYANPLLEQNGNLHMSRCVIYGATNAGVALMGSGTITIDHCDIVNGGGAGVGAISLVQDFDPGIDFSGNVLVTNSNLLGSGGKSLAGAKDAAGTVNNHHNNVPDGVDGAWTSSPTNFAVDPQFVNAPDDFTVQAEVLFSAGSDGKDIGSVDIAQTPGQPPPSAVHDWTIY